MRDGFRAITSGWMLIDDFDDLTDRIERAAEWTRANGSLLADEEATIDFMIDARIARGTSARRSTLAEIANRVASRLVRKLKSNAIASISDEIVRIELSRDPECPADAIAFGVLEEITTRLINEQRGRSSAGGGAAHG